MSCNGMAFFPTNFMLQASHEDEHHHHHHHHQSPISLSPILPSCAPQDFHGVAAASFLGKRSMSFTGIDVVGEEANGGGGGGGGEDDLSDDDEGSQAGGGEKKRRLNMEQVKTLEKNFELGNKLEPERKMQLARALGLQPRQIAIWFQNRRARWKTKQLEIDYDLLKRQFDSIKADNEALHAQNQKLHSEIMALKSKEVIITESINLNKDTDQGSCSNRSENSCDIKLHISSTTTPAAAIDSPPPPPPPQSTHPTSINFFPSTSMRSTMAPQLFHNSSSSSSTRPDLHQCVKIEQQSNNKEHECLSSMFCGMDDHTGFWPWLEQHNFS